MLLYHYINVRSSIIFCLISKDIYHSFGISAPLSTVLELFCGEVIETFVILLAILLQIKAPLASAVFLIAFLKQF